MDDDDYFLAAMAAWDAQLLNNYFLAPEPEVVPEPPADTHMMGVHREPKMGVVRAKGNYFQRPDYIFTRGKKVSTRASKRWGF